MPELPEVEVTRLGIAPHLEGQTVTAIITRQAGLRWPFPTNLEKYLTGQVIRCAARRGKYLLLTFDHGTLLLHLGMSGRLRILPNPSLPEKHDHFDLVVGSQLMRLTDPRRFGAVLWHAADEGDVNGHVLLRGLGVEPLEQHFSAELLYRQTRHRTAPIKQVLLMGDIVVGVGNIYASESLFRAGINPKTPARRIGLARYEKLAVSIRDILAQAILQGGSTLRDFVGANGLPGYFQQSYFVYNRHGKQCRMCAGIVRQIRQGQRSTFYCVNCQK